MPDLPTAKSKDKKKRKEKIASDLDGVIEEQHAFFDDDEDALAQKAAVDAKRERKEKRKQERDLNRQQALVKESGTHDSPNKIEEQDDQIEKKPLKDSKSSKKSETDCKLSRKRSRNESASKSDATNYKIDPLMELVNTLLPPPEMLQSSSKKTRTTTSDLTAVTASSSSCCGTSTAMVTPAASNITNEGTATTPETNADTEWGSYDPTQNEWSWSLAPDLRLRVGYLKGRPFVDIRYLWKDMPSKKGAFLPVHIFEKIQKFPKLQEALAKTRR